MYVWQMRSGRAPSRSRATARVRERGEWARAVQLQACRLPCGARRAPRPRARGSVHGGDWGGQLSCSISGACLLSPVCHAVCRVSAPRARAARSERVASGVESGESNRRGLTIESSRLAGARGGRRFFVFIIIYTNFIFFFNFMFRRFRGRGRAGLPLEIL